MSVAVDGSIRFAGELGLDDLLSVSGVGLKIRVERSVHRGAMVGRRCHEIGSGRCVARFLLVRGNSRTRPVLGHSSENVASIYKRQCRFCYGG